MAIVSTIAETPNPEQELLPADELIGSVLERFISITEIFEPIDDGNEDNVFVSRTYDATSHFESTCEDILSLYKRIMREELNYEEPLKPFTEEEGYQQQLEAAQNQMEQQNLQQ